MSELYHHGILGQKWGKQNGPPYPLKPSAHSAAEKKHMSPRERAKQMSDKELDEAVTRLRKEKEYIDLSGKQITEGRNFAENMAIILGTTLVTSAVTALATKTGQAAAAGIIKKGFGDAIFKAVYKGK